MESTDNNQMPGFSEQLERLRDCSWEHCAPCLEEITEALALQAKLQTKEPRSLTEDLFLSLRSDLRSLSSDFSALLALTLHLLHSHRSLQDQIQDHQSHSSILERKLRDYEQGLEDTQTEAKAKEKAMEELEGMYQEKEQMLHVMGAEVGQLRTEVKRLKREAGERQEGEQRKAALAAQEEASLASAARDAHMQRLHSLEDLTSTLESELSDASHLLTAERSSCEKLRQALTLAKSQAAKLRSDNDELMMSLMEYEHKVKDLEHEGLKQKTQIQTLLRDTRRQSGHYEAVSYRSGRTASVEDEDCEGFESLGGFIMENEAGELKRRPELGICQRPDICIVQEKRPAEIQLQVVAIAVAPVLRSRPVSPRSGEVTPRRLSTARSVTTILYKCVKTDIAVQTTAEKKRTMILKRFKQAEIPPKKKGAKGNSNMILKTVHIAKVAPRPRPRVLSIATETSTPALLLTHCLSATVICRKDPPALELWHSEELHIGRWSVFEIMTYSTEDDVQSQLSTPRSIHTKSRLEIRRDPTEEFFTLV